VLPLLLLLLLFTQSPALVLWNQLEELLALKMPCASKIKVPLHVYVEITILVMAGPVEQAVMKVSNN